MLATKYRLRNKKDFEKVKKQGKIYQTKLFGMNFLKNSEVENPRFAFIVSSKISKLAVQRNRIKRAIREAVRHSLHLIKEGYDIIFLAKPKIARSSTEVIMREVKISLRESGIAK